MCDLWSPLPTSAPRERRAKNSFPLLLLAALGLGGAACEGYVESPPGLATVGPAHTEDAPPQAAAAPSNGAGATPQTDASSSPTSRPVWAGAVGDWCGPFDKQTLWLTLQSQAVACSAASTKIYADASPDTSEGLTVELDRARLTTLPAELS